LVQADVRHEPPEQEVTAVVAVEGATPKPLVVDALVFFDREGNIDMPELEILVGRRGQPLCCGRFDFEHTDDPSPSPTNGRITKFALKTLDLACDAIGEC
jgi:hypothetical protein